MPKKEQTTDRKESGKNNDQLHEMKLNGKFLFDRPRSVSQEWSFSLKAVWELLKGYRTFHKVGPCVSVFGSARFSEDHPYYKKARLIGNSLAEMGFTVMTGGGPGIMEAANRGAFEVGGNSVGCNIRLPSEPGYNEYLDKVVTFKYFFIRKVLLFKYSYAFVIMPGGFGTMDELFEALTLLQTKKIRPMPIVMMGKDFWKPLLETMERMKEEKTIDQEDTDLFKVTDDPEEALEHIRINAIQRYGLDKKG